MSFEGRVWTGFFIFTILYGLWGIQQGSKVAYFTTMIGAVGLLIHLTRGDENDR